MGVLVKYGTIAVGAYYAHQPGTHQAAFGDQYWPKWDRGGAKSPRTCKDRMQWASLWPTSRFSGGAGGTGTDAMIPVGMGLDSSGMFEPFSCDGEGSQSLKFLRGMVVTSADVAVSGALVSAYRTSDNAFAGYTDQSRDDGTYAVATQFGTGNHYVTAYKPGSPDVGGTTVNTLTPANIDGT